MYCELMVWVCEWVVGMQSSDGGWGVFELENMQYYLNNILFFDYGVLFDLLMVDVLGCCLLMLLQFGEMLLNSELVCCVFDYMLKEQELDGSWYGCWGMNYVYGMWIVLCLLNVVGLMLDDLCMKCGVQWLLLIQNKDGGWGEDGDSYKLNYCGYEQVLSMVLQMVWVLFGLMVVGEVNNLVVVCGVDYLVVQQNEEGLWDEMCFIVMGFLCVFYLCYYGYCKFFLLWVFVCYCNLKCVNVMCVMVGM